jgi:hypothetical protein
LARTKKLTDHHAKYSSADGEAQAGGAIENAVKKYA